VRAVVEPLVRTMAKLNLDQGLSFAIDIDASVRVRADQGDLEEMLGNLLENACRHARSAVKVRPNRSLTNTQP
jgi:signal transduction histidine kinase